MSVPDCVPPMDFGEHLLTASLGLLIAAAFAGVLLGLMLGAFHFGEGLFSGTAVYESRRQKVQDGIIAAAFVLAALVLIITATAAVTYSDDDKPTCTQEQMQ